MINWRCTGISVQGQSHMRNDKPCQDAQAWAQVNDHLILVCADGAGSAAHAEWGSALAVETVISYMISHLIGKGSVDDFKDKQSYFLDLLHNAFKSAHGALAELATREEVVLRDLATTLMLAAVSDEYTVAAQIGDGAIVCSMDGNNEYKTLTTPFHGQYVNETAFLTQENYTDYLQILVTEGSACQLALFSDGFEPVAVKYATGEPNPGLFTGLFRFMNETSSHDVRKDAVTRLLTGKRISERSDDDKTLVLAIQCNRLGEEQSTCA